MTSIEDNSAEDFKKEGSGSSSDRPAKSSNGSYKNRKKGDLEVQSGESGTSAESTTNKAERLTQAKLEPLAVTVDTNLDKAMKILKRKLIKEGLFKELKTRRYYEKPSEKKKRKMKETIKKLRKEEARARKNSLI